MAEKTSFSCGDALDISHVAALKVRLEKSLQKASTIELKANDVEKVDTAGLQLVVSLKKEVTTLHGKIIWKSPSEKLIHAAMSLGLKEYLEL